MTGGPMDPFFYEIFRDLPRYGPGGNRYTERAFRATGLPPDIKILDVGCGSGMQTIHLAQISNASITAVDNCQYYLDELDKTARLKDLSDRIKTSNQDMNKMNFPPSAFDLIWSEGAIYIAGFKDAITAWKRFLKPDGFMAVSEICWTKENSPRELTDFWRQEYPAITTPDELFDTCRKAFFRVVDHFFLPADVWWDDYYQPLQKRVSMLRSQHRKNADRISLLEMVQHEIEIFKKYSDYYAYIFLVVQDHSQTAV